MTTIAQELRRLYETGEPQVEPIHDFYFHIEGARCYACVNGTIAVAAIGLQRMKDWSNEHSVRLEEDVPILGIQLLSIPREHGLAICPCCGEETDYGILTVRRFIDHLYEDDKLTSRQVFTELEKLPELQVPLLPSAPSEEPTL